MIPNVKDIYPRRHNVNKFGRTDHVSCSKQFTITPNDVKNIEHPGAYIWINDVDPVQVKLELIDGDGAMVYTVVRGLLPFHVKKVWNTGTTANNIIGLI